MLVTLEEAARALLADQPEPPAERDLANVLLTIQQVDRLVAVVPAGNRHRPDDGWMTPSTRPGG